MRVEVLRILHGSQDLVRFTCESGDACGRWMGSAPAQTGRFDVEIEVPEEVTDWAAVPSAVTSLSQETGTEPAALITGEVVRFDVGDDPVVEIRVGSDILLIEIPNRRSELTTGGLIAFRVSEIQLYPYYL